VQCVCRWLTGQLGCLRHHALLRGLREEVEDQSTRATTAKSQVAAPSGNKKRAERKAVRRANKGASAEGSTRGNETRDESAGDVLGYLSPAELGGGFETMCCPHYMYLAYPSETLCHKITFEKMEKEFEKSVATR
jgi:hypothetical protein